MQKKLTSRKFEGQPQGFPRSRAVLNVQKQFQSFPISHYNTIRKADWLLLTKQKNQKCSKKNPKKSSNVFFFFLLFLPVSNLVLSSFTKAHASPLSTKLCIKQRNRCWKVTSFYDLQSETYSLPQGFRRGFPSHTVCGKSTAHWFRPNKCKL